MSERLSLDQARSVREILVVIRPARTEDEAPLLQMFDEAVAWLVERGQSEQWGSEPWSQAEKGRCAVRSFVEGGGLYMLELDGALVGALEVGQHPEYVQALDVPELYIRLVITSRRFSGKKIGDRLIDEALDIARRQGAAVVRVDCWAGAASLVAWYESQGFTRSGTFTIDGWRGQVLARSL
jgi:ribosomal protein S18 acetylase RimI-like enzyme